MNSRNITAIDRAHLARVKALPCSVCAFDPPSEAHHINQGDHFTCVALCRDCHTGTFNGWHGQRRRWKLSKMDELAALNVTLKRLAIGLDKKWA